MSEITLSIVVPAYNYAALLPRALQSVYSQLLDNDELWVINDGSTDNTKEVLLALQSNMPKLNVHHQSNQGLAAVRNKGINISKGTFLIFLDADDELLPGALACFHKSVESNPNAGLHIASTIAVFEDGRQKQNVVAKLAETKEQRFLDYLHKRLSLANGAVAMHRQLFSTLSYPPIRQTEDIPVFAAALAKMDAVRIEHATTKIYKHKDSMRHDINAALNIGEALVSEIFDTGILPNSFKKYKQDYAAKRALSLFRMCYKAGEKKRARAFFIKAWKLRASIAVSKPSYLLKFIRCYF